MLSQKKRLTYIDIFRGIGIVFMVMGHIGFGDFFDFFIHAFHMPMFFFVSGMFYKKKSETELKTIDYIKIKAKSLLVPYIVVGLLHYVIWMFVNWDNISPDPLIHLLWINTTNLPMGSIWFLTALFITQVVYFFIDRYVASAIIKNILIIIISLLGNFETIILPFRLPYSIGPAFVGVGLFHIAHILVEHSENIRIKKMLNMPLIMGVISAIGVTALVFCNGYVNMRTGIYSIVPLFWINAVGAIIVGINFAKYAENILPSPVNAWLELIGKRSIAYVCWNQVVILFVVRYLDELEIFRPLVKLLILGVTMFLLNIGDWLYNMFMQWMDKRCYSLKFGK